MDTINSPFANPYQNLLPKDGEAMLFRAFFSPEACSRYFEILLNETPWIHEPIWMFGKQVMQPRLTAWYGETGKAYTYSGTTMTPYPWTTTLLEIKQRIEAVCGVTFTNLLLNQYRNERDSVSWHRDNEVELGHEPVIGSVSFGAPRTFQMRHYLNKELKTSIELTDGSFLWMRGATQDFWEHCVPKRTRPLGPRINLTFRVLKGEETQKDECPMCRKSNACDIAKGNSTCWCFDVTVPASLVNKGAEAQKSASCICRSCIEALG